MTPRKAGSTRRKYRRRRDYGKTSPLDRLQAREQAKLLKMLEGTASYATIRLWLENRHAVKTSPTALSRWRNRRLGDGGQANSKTLRFRGFTITIEADDARPFTARTTSVVREGRRKR